ncbi:hypothetical protein K491DRAFT_588139 [Lophiostoma macrostomum CBS 122681]|uniref:Uncharacterized protein n=1 Tax=Lophiostoma macrostomum CBS 122681 TaxID=1314788 RepID=A0A6A6TMM5_9PLEO|nr:hypothetical protein K491DRAFT_588139 [Lophiostoma macrostomum CBS 122681]
MQAVDPTLIPLKAPKGNEPNAKPAFQQPAELGVLSNLKGTFTGTGFNMIFRPKANSLPASTFPTPLSNPSEDNVLELNLTREKWVFSAPLDKVPNRGFGAQDDIDLGAVPYAQFVDDLTNPNSGKADDPNPLGIHFETGIFLQIPDTKTNPVIGNTLSRMASIPHGTTINAQGLAPSPSQKQSGPPVIPSVNVTPFNPRDNHPISFESQIFGTGASSRLPQNLSKFNDNKSITPAILSNPNQVLSDANDKIKDKILDNISFTVSTKRLDGQLGGGTSSIAFLEGADLNAGSQTSPNASVPEVTATFWLSTVQHKILVPAGPAWKEGTPPAKATAVELPAGVQAPSFLVRRGEELKKDTVFTVKAKQMQYSQTVILFFGGLFWPHVSVATVVPFEREIGFGELVKVG